MTPFSYPDRIHGTSSPFGCPEKIAPLFVNTHEDRNPAIDSEGFTATPNTILLDRSLSRDARFLYTLLKSRGRARTGWQCAVGYGWLCTHMGAGEDLVRRAMDELVMQGVVLRERHGQGRVNSYRLLMVEGGRTRQERVLEPGERGEKEDELEEHRERATAFESSRGTSKCDISMVKLPDLLPPPAEDPLPRILPRITPPPADPERDAVTLLLGDLRRELGDRAPLGATVSRAINLKRRAGADWEAFATAVYSARAATQARTHAIRDRDRTGAHKAGYFFAVLADRLGMRAAPVPPPAPAPVATCTDPPPLPPPSVPRAAHPLPPPEAPDGERAAFWERLRAETGIGDLQAYCRACGRPPVYDDLARSLQIARERSRR